MNDNEFKCELLPEDYLNYDLTFKLIVIGESGIKLLFIKVSGSHVLQQKLQRTYSRKIIRIQLVLNSPHST